MLAVLCALIAGSCARVGARVTVLGDSITALGTNQIERSLGDRYDLAVSGVFGDRTDQRLQAAKLQAALRPTDAIINLGTNDVLQHRQTAGIVRNLETLVETYASVGTRCIYLVTINTHLDQDGNQPHQAAVELNDAMEQLAERTGGVSLIRWDEIVDDALPEQLTFDGVHPNDEGQRRLVDAYGAALRNC